MNRFVRPLALAGLCLALAACGKGAERAQDLDDLDAELAASAAPGNQADPALTTALHDQIMVDPALAQSANDNAVRPPPRPDPMAVPRDTLGVSGDGVDAATLAPAPPAKDCPDCRRTDGALTLGELAARQPQPTLAECAPRIGYSAGWANRLPPDVPLYPDARVAEAAGAADCPLRIVSFASGADVGRIVNWYYAKLRAAGFGAEHRAKGAKHVLGGTRGEDAYILYVSPRPGGGSDVDLVANGGR